MMTYCIYVIDDEKTAREGLALALKKSYIVEAFGLAEEAIKALDSTPPDLVLLDIGLPGMSGIEALQAIKHQHPDVIERTEMGRAEGKEGIFAWLARDCGHVEGASSILL